jgi:type I restriction enzyme R subunit
METAEQLIHKTIDTLLERSGWIVQSYEKIDPAAGRGLAVRDIRLVEGHCDYLLLLDRNPVGFVKARKNKPASAAAKDENQSEREADKLPDYMAQLFPGGIVKLPFHYDAVGAEIYFRDEREARPRARSVRAFHRPETLAQRLEKPPAAR